MRLIVVAALRREISHAHAEIALVEKMVCVLELRYLSEFFYGNAEHFIEFFSYVTAAVSCGIFKLFYLKSAAAVDDLSCYKTDQQ